MNCVDGQIISQPAQEMVQHSDGGHEELQMVFKVIDESEKK